jgi:hypothetical protein
MTHRLRHAPARRADHQVHQLESAKAWHILHVNSSRNLCRQHSLGPVKGAICGHFDCFSHRNYLKQPLGSVNRAIPAQYVAFPAQYVAFPAQYVASEEEYYLKTLGYKR